MSGSFFINKNIDKEGNDSSLSFIFELVIIFALIWVLLFIAPSMILGKGATKGKDGLMDFLLDFYNYPEKFYPILTIFSFGLTGIYCINQIKFTKIVEIRIIENQIIFRITNRLGNKFKSFTFDRKEIRSVLNVTIQKEIKGIHFFTAEKKIGYYEFIRFTSLNLAEKTLIEVLEIK